MLSGAPDGDLSILPRRTTSPSCATPVLDVRMADYAFCQLRGHLRTTSWSVRCALALLAGMREEPRSRSRLRHLGRPAGYESTLDHAKAIAERCPGRLANTTDTPSGDPLGVFHSSYTLRRAKPRASRTCSFRRRHRRGEEGLPLAAARRSRAGADDRLLPQVLARGGRDAGRRGQPRRAVGESEHAADAS